MVPRVMLASVIDGGLGAGKDCLLDLRREEGETDDALAVRGFRRLVQDRQAEGIPADSGMGCTQRADECAVGARTVTVAFDDLGATAACREASGEAEDHSLGICGVRNRAFVGTKG